MLFLGCGFQPPQSVEVDRIEEVVSVVVGLIIDVDVDGEDLLFLCYSC